MKPSPYTSSFQKHRLNILLVFVSALLYACNPSRVPPKPNVQITLVPPANPGGPVQLDFIEGRASGVKPGQQIVLYARSGDRKSVV